MADLDADPFKGASHRSMFAHLSGPFTGGAVDAPLSLDGAGRAVVDRLTRQPLVVVAPRQDVGPQGFELTVAVTPSSGAVATATVRFEPFTEAGCFLPLYWPPPGQEPPGGTPGFEVKLTPPAGVPATALSTLVELRLTEGVMGRLLYVVGAEKQRIRRQAREVFSARRLDAATGDALDRLGAELGVPRFTDQLSWDATKAQPQLQPGREADPDYRRRLSLYRPFLMASRRRVQDLLNSKVAEQPDGADRFALRESNSEFAVAIRLLAVPGDLRRQQFLAHARQVYLLSPGAPVPPQRLLPRSERERQEQMLARLREHFEFPEGAWLAPALAQALDRAGRCRSALGVTRRWRVLRAQDDAGGSRYELGLGLDAELMPVAELDALAARLQELAADLRMGSLPPGMDLETARLLVPLTPAPASEDPVGRWLLKACGFKTVHLVPGSRCYLSHLQMAGLVLDVESLSEQSPRRFELAARSHGAGDPGPDAVLIHGLRDVEADALAAAVPPWTRLSRADAETAWSQVALPAPATAAAFSQAGLRTPLLATELQRATAGLRKLPPELLVTVALAPGLAAALQQWVGWLRRRELVSVLPLVRGAQVLLVVGATALPGSAAVLNGRREGIRWSRLRLDAQGPTGTLARVMGARNSLTLPTEGGFFAVVALLLVRRDQDDPRGIIRPYEVQVELPPGALLELGQYEQLMNLLSRAAPVGVTFNTLGVRERHVAPSGEGGALPFTGQRARFFRAFRQPRRTSASQSLTEQPQPTVALKPSAE